MSTSIWLLIRGRGDDGQNTLELTPNEFGHLTIKAEPGADASLLLELSVVASAGLGRGECHVKDAANEGDVDDPVDHAGRDSVGINEEDRRLIGSNARFIGQGYLLNLMALNPSLSQGYKSNPPAADVSRPVSAEKAA